LVNQDKSAIFFSSNCKEEVKKEMFECLKIGKEAPEEKYLGLPTALGRSTTEAFESICSRIRNLVSGWCEKKLSAAGREFLIKAVAQSIPIYSMCCFQLSKTACRKITSAISQFYWGGDEEKRKMHWRKWTDIAYTKLGGGMGFKDLHMCQAILKGKEVLEKVLIKRVGDGNTINIWNGQWIPNNPGFKPIYRKPKAQAERVHELLSPDGMSWNLQAL
jgi:hypothetical protein